VNRRIRRADRERGQTATHVSTIPLANQPQYRAYVNAQSHIQNLQRGVDPRMYL